MSVTVAKRDTHAVVTISGSVDGKTAPEVQAAIAPLVGAFPLLVLDLTEVGYMSSAGLRVLLLVHRNLSAKGGKAVLVGLREEIAETMRVTGFLQFFELSPTVADLKL